MSAYIYCIINHITNQRYIGKTEHSVQTRFQRHKSNALRGDDTYLYRSMRKYGVDNFSIDLVETTTEDLVNLREVYYIQSLLPEFNMTTGGDGGSTTHSRMWVNNGVENKYILKEDKIPEGFTKGRLCKFNDPLFQSEMGKRAHSKIDFTKRNVGNKWNNKSVVINGVEYESRKQAMQQLNITKHFLYKILNASNTN